MVWPLNTNEFRLCHWCFHFHFPSRGLLGRKFSILFLRFYCKNLALKSALDFETLEPFEDDDDPLLVEELAAAAEVFFKTLGTKDNWERPLPRGPRSEALRPEPPPRLFDTVTASSFLTGGWLMDTEIVRPSIT